MHLDSIVSFPTSAFPPIAVGFFGLGTGYLIYGPQELFKFPPRDRRVDLSTGIWGIWMPGFMQFFVGVYLFAGLAWFHSFSAPALYMAALAFTAYGVQLVGDWAQSVARSRSTAQRLYGHCFRPDIDSGNHRLFQRSRSTRGWTLHWPDVYLCQRLLRKPEARASN
jgi:hypothetical protein